MTKLELRKSIKAALLTNQDLNETQIEYVKRCYEPKYENDCGPCRLNVMLSLRIPHDVAFKVLDPDAE